VLGLNLPTGVTPQDLDILMLNEIAQKNGQFTTAAGICKMLTLPCLLYYLQYLVGHSLIGMVDLS
jgi:hypothetical protein